MTDKNPVAIPSQDHGFDANRAPMVVQGTQASTIAKEDEI